MASSTDAQEIAHDFVFFRVFKDGRIEFKIPGGKEKVVAGNDPVTGVQSKDVVISSDPPVSVRIFLPKIPDPTQKILVLFYVHGGGFSMMSPASPQYHLFCSIVAAATPALVVSVEYGMFPARPIPACYEDSWAALQWVASHCNGAGPEPWLNEHADFSRVFVGGDSAGGNITHTLVFRAGTVGLPGSPTILGAVYVHPYFGGTEDDHMWLYMHPRNSGLDDPRLNPTAPDLARIGCGKVLVFVAEKDHLNPVGKRYYEELKKSGWRGQAELVENFGEEHCFHVRNASCDKAKELVHKFVSFIKQDNEQ